MTGKRQGDRPSNGFRVTKFEFHQVCSCQKRKKIPLSLVFECREQSSDTPFLFVFSVISFYILNLSFLLSWSSSSTALCTS